MLAESKFAFRQARKARRSSPVLISVQQVGRYLAVLKLWIVIVITTTLRCCGGSAAVCVHPPVTCMESSMRLCYPLTSFGRFGKSLQAKRSEHEAKACVGRRAGYSDQVGTP